MRHIILMMSLCSLYLAAACTSNAEVNETTPAPIITASPTEQACELQHVWQGSNVLTLIYESPDAEQVVDAIGRLGGICYNSTCPRELPVVARLQEPDWWYEVEITYQFRYSENWPQKDYPYQTAWIDIRDDSRLIGDCSDIRIRSTR